MAVDDNTNYELSGSQVKDLATRIKGNTKLAKDLVGGAPRVSKRINVFQLTDYDEATEISNQIDNPDVYPVLLEQLLKYAFYDVNWGKYLNRYEIGEAIVDNCDFVYFSTYGDDGSVQKIIVRANANYDSGTDTYSPSFLIYEINEKTPYGGGKMYTLSLNETAQTGLEDWYAADLSTWSHEPSYIIQRMTSAEAQEIANKINADNPGVYVTLPEVQNYMKFVCRNATTGKMVQTASAFRQALFRGSTDAYFLPSMAGSSANLEVMVFKGGGASAAGFSLTNMNTLVTTPYNIANPSSSYGTNAEYMWYIAEEENADISTLATEKLVKDLSGGESRTSGLIYMTWIDTDNAQRIADEISDTALTVMNNMVYRFFYAETGEEIKSPDNLSNLIGSGYVIEYLNQPGLSSDDNAQDTMVITATKSIVDDEDEEIYHVELQLKSISQATGNVISKNIVVDHAPEGASYWYKTTTTEGPAGRVACLVQDMFGSGEVNGIAAEINASLPEGVDPLGVSQVWGIMELLFRDPQTGEFCKTISQIRALLRTGNSYKGKVVYIPHDNNNTAGMIVTRYGWTGSASTGHGFVDILDLNTGELRTYNVADISQAGFTDNRQYCWYYVYVDSTKMNYSCGYFEDNATVYDVTTEAPSAKFELTYDANNNLYMAAGASSASDWKQINNSGDSSYSTSEIKTSGTWIDGKPIYKKTFSFTLANAESTTVNHGISNFGLLIKFEGAVVSSSTKTVPIPRTLTNLSYQVGLEGVTATSFEVDVGASGPKGSQAYITLWYTKTTD